MEKTQAGLTYMKTTSALVATSIKSMSVTIHVMARWMAHVDTSISMLLTSITDLGEWVATLEADNGAPPTEAMPQPEGHNNEFNHQGTVAGAITAPTHVLVRGKCTFPQTPMQFSLGECSTTPDPSQSAGSRFDHGGSHA